ncbi:MAG TPA: DinB family protein, partial [Planctomycetota bacterium]|nr:DinB family protein [Planctomycetota bacterium]
HVFAAEKRYVERLSGRPLTEQAAVPIAFAALFQFGRQSRKELREFVVAFPAGQWDTPAEHTILTHTLRLTPRKIIVHVLLHEIRHWAQIATVLRLGGEKVEMHDFLFSPVMGGDPRAGGRA